MTKSKGVAAVLVFLFSHMPNGHAGYEEVMAKVDVRVLLAKQQEEHLQKVNAIQFLK